MAGRRQFFDYVASEWAFRRRNLVNIGGTDVGHVICGRRIEHAESIVVTGGEHHVFHPGGLRDSYPLVGVEIRWIELFVEIVIDIGRDLRATRPTDFVT